eukprot:GILJ01005653.1.p1 GENE.GILJ01005653.1~~GILJ01005653.1.p1  ORF type:complete len:139 (-),score=19.33 GILJ01005653.1:63-479(-)
MCADRLQSVPLDEYTSSHLKMKKIDLENERTTIRAKFERDDGAREGQIESELGKIIQELEPREELPLCCFLGVTNDKWNFVSQADSDGKFFQNGFSPTGTLSQRGKTLLERIKREGPEPNQPFKYRILLDGLYIKFIE